MKETRARIADCLILCGEDPSTENVNKLEIFKTENDLIEKYIAQGVIAYLRAKWYGEEDRSNMYFLN